MDKIKSYSVGFILAALAVVPPINFSVNAPSDYWPWWIMMAGFLGFYTMFLKTSLIVKFLAVAGFINCFFSSSPYLSFTSYISIVFMCYFFMLCKSIKDYGIVFRVLQCLLIFTSFMFVMQIAGLDRLLNFGRSVAPIDFCFGIVGQHMQSASLSVVLAAALMPFNVFNLSFPFITSVFCNSAGGFLCASSGIIAFFYKKIQKRYFLIPVALLIIFSLWMVLSGKLNANTYAGGGRLTVWKSTVHLAIQRPLMGWGAGMYKSIFPALGGISGVPWKTAHNCWLQLLFEFGIPITMFISGYFVYLMVSLARLTRRASFRKNAFRCLAGLTMISLNMCFHFPTRVLGCVLIIIFFLAYCQKIIDTGGVRWQVQA